MKSIAIGPPSGLMHSNVPSSLPRIHHKDLPTPSMLSSRIPAAVNPRAGTRIEDQGEEDAG